MMSGFIKNLLFLIPPITLLLKTKDGISANKINYNKKSERCLILGNGPSLNDDISSILAHKSDSDFMCVNSFPITDLFFEIKPEYFVLLDIAWWIKNPHPDDLELRNSLYKRLGDVDWKLQLIVPNNADLNFVKDQISNKYIEVVKMKNANIYRPLNKKAFKYYDTGYFAPPFTNVLVFAVFCAIKAGYKQIYIYGADLSYLFLIDVDQQTNRVYIKNEHFYETGEKEILREHFDDEFRGATMFEFIQAQAYTLRSHELLNHYAKNKGIEIYNKSSYSIIDAYNR